MKLTNYILKLSGFADFQDYFGWSSSLIKPLFMASVWVGSFVGFIEAYSGISFMFWIFLVAGTFFDIGLGMYTSILHLKQPFDMDKFFKGLFKSCIVLLMIFLTNQLKLGVETSEITPEFLKIIGIYTIATVHYSAVFLISLFLLLGVSQNGEKIGIKACASINKIIRLRINNVEGASLKN